MVAHDQGDVAGELAGAVAQEQIVEAVVVARDEDRHALALAGQEQAPLHLEAAGHLRDGPLEARAVGPHLGEVEADALEELAGQGVRMLVGVEDVEAMPVEQLGQGCDDAAPVRAGHEQGPGLGGGRPHGGRFSVAGLSMASGG